MTMFLRRPEAIIAFTLLTAGGSLTWLSMSERIAQHRPQALGYPTLFLQHGSCHAEIDPRDHARRSEEVARLRADRYAYDPREGVRAVHRYQESAACYRMAGDEAGARRARRAGATLVHRVNTDYAAARLNLSNALEREHWSVALGEIRRLLLLTDHVGRHEYVEWLSAIIGRVEVEASRAS